MGVCQTELPWQWEPYPELGLRDIDPQRVLVIKPSALGDVVQSLPVLGMLRQRFPQTQLAWLIKDSLAQLLQGHPLLDQVLVWQTQEGRWRSFWGLLREVRAGEFDLVVDLQGLFRTGMLSWYSGARWRVGFSNAREGARWAYTHRVLVPSRDLPALVKYALVAQALGCQGPVPQAVIPIQEEHRRWAMEHLATLPHPWVAAHPGARWPTKQWPPDRLARALQILQQHSAAGVVVLGGPEERTLADQVAQALSGPVLNLAGKTSLLQLAAVLEQCEALISGDTGPMHLAAALGTAVVAVFTCTSPLRAGPRGSQHRVLAAQIPCASSYRRRCRHLSCMSLVAPEQVAQAAQELLHHQHRDPQAA